MDRSVLALSDVNRPAIAAGLVLGALLRSGAAWADDDLARARALFEEAGEYERQGKWPAAQQSLRQALRLRETPQLHYALGWALENDDKLLEAKVEYETALKQAQNRAGAEEPARLATARLADLDKKMPIIKVHVGGGSRGNARVLVDGREIKREDDTATTPVNPGSHVIRIERTGTNEDAVEQMAYVGRSTVRTIDVDAGDAVASRDTTQDRPAVAVVHTSEAPKSGSDKTLPIVLIASGGALVIGGVALLAASSSDASTRDQMHANWCTATACVNNQATRAETTQAASYRRQSSDAADAGNTKQALGFVIGGVGLAAAAMGTYFLVKPGNKESTTQLGAAVLPGGGFASASLKF